MTDAEKLKKVMDLFSAFQKTINLNSISKCTTCCNYNQLIERARSYLYLDMVMAEKFIHELNILQNRYAFYVQDKTIKKLKDINGKNFLKIIDRDEFGEFSLEWKNIEDE